MAQEITSMHCPETQGIPEMLRVKLNIVPVIQDIVEAKGLMVIKTIPGNASNTAFYH